jgi:hypothetical protein
MQAAMSPSVENSTANSAIDARIMTIGRHAGMGTLSGVLRKPTIRKIAPKPRMIHASARGTKPGPISAAVPMLSEPVAPKATSAKAIRNSPKASSLTSTRGTEDSLLVAFPTENRCPLFLKMLCPRAARLFV